MLKLMHKKLNKKGFTLAELLVVIAILAILIAIAVPVFTNMVAEANLRVNQANVRSLRSAAVAHILTNLGGYDYSGTPRKLNEKIGHKEAGWVATAAVDNNGNISQLHVFVCDNTASYKDGISITAPTDHAAFEEADLYPISDDLETPFATVKPSMGTGTTDPKVYYVQAVVTDLDVRATKS